MKQTATIAIAGVNLTDNYDAHASLVRDRRVFGQGHPGYLSRNRCRIPYCQNVFPKRNQDNGNVSSAANA